jgi:hypothetical protein
MNSSRTSPRGRQSFNDWLPTLVVTPTLLSLVSHAILLVVMATTLRSCERAPVGFSNEPTREIGIVVIDEGDRPDAQIPGESNDVAPSSQPAESTTANDVLATQTPLPEPSSTSQSLPPRETSSNVGPGVNLPSSATVSDPRDSVKLTGGSRAAATGRIGGPRGAAFMGTHADGMKVIFIIDASGSMYTYGALNVAKASLVASLESLDPKQQFMVIFYDDQPHVLLLQGQEKPTLAYATEINKSLARQSIAGVQPGQGTQHIPALTLALKMIPDAIFFLTDADNNTPIYAKEIEKLKKLNGGRSQIHSIEFGEGPELGISNDRGNFLRKLSHENGGTYRYHDVTKFSSK